MPVYCDATCQHDHWRRGHKQICKKIHRGGNAEQYHADKKYKEAVAVAVEACVSLMRRVGAPEKNLLVVQSNLASSYQTFGRQEQALEMYRSVYSGNLKIDGEEHASTLVAALNTAACLWNLQRLEEVRSLLRKTIPVARRVLGESNESTLRMRSIYGQALYRDEGATLDEHREAVTTLEETARIARQVFGGAHPVTEGIERPLRKAQAALRDREVELFKLKYHLSVAATSSSMNSFNSVAFSASPLLMTVH